MDWRSGKEEGTGGIGIWKVLSVEGEGEAEAEAEAARLELLLPLLTTLS